MKKTLIEEMSWEECGEIFKNVDMIIIPLGVCEEHGLHNPLGTDTFIAKASAEEIGKRLGIPVAPTLPFGYSPRVTSFAGTISIDPDLYRKVLISYAESYIKWGIKRILFVNGHGGNNGSIGEVSRKLYEKHNVICFSTQWWEHLPKLNKEWSCDDHGGKYETSYMLAVNESLVDMSKATNEPVSPLTDKLVYNHGWSFKGSPTPLPMDLYKLNRVGNVGCPANEASKDLGEKLMERYIQFNVDLGNEILKLKLN